MQYVSPVFYLSDSHTQVHSGLVFTLASVCFLSIFIFTSALLIQARLLSCPTGSFISLSVLTLLFFPIPSLLLSHFSPSSFFCFCLLLSFSLSLHTTPPSLFISLLYSLSLTQFLSVSHPPSPLPPPLLFLSLFLSLFIFLSSLPSLTQSLSLSLIPQFPPSSLFLLSLASSITLFSLTHSFFSVSFSLPLSDCFKSSNYK